MTGGARGIGRGIADPKNMFVYGCSGGGVLTAGHALLMDEIHRLLLEAAPLASTTVVRTPPVVGAALLGLDRIDAPPSARERLRDQFLPPVVS